MKLCRPCSRNVGLGTQSHRCSQTCSMSVRTIGRRKQADSRTDTFQMERSGKAPWRGPISNWDDPLEKEMTTHSSILAWRIPWTEEPGRLQSIRLQKVEHN